ncbi:GumC family protein [Antarctobacter sp.]|uniref:GumC family protein n=1 Tax=Antarctobacter sp. TaxID=1872577 RepID=UPI003A951EC9
MKQVASLTAEPWRATDDDGQLGDSLREALALLRRNLFRMFAVGLIFALTGLILAQRMDRLFKSNVQLMVERPVVSPIEVEQAVGRVDLGYVDGQILLLTSDDMLRRVIDEAELLAEPWFQPTEPGPVRLIINAIKALIPTARGTPGTADPQDRATLGALRQLADAVSVRREGETNVIRIDASATSPELAQRIAATMAQVYQDMRLEFRSAEARLLTDWVDARANELRGKLAEAERAATTYRIENNLIGIKDGSGLSDQQLTELNAELIRSRADLAQKRASFEQAQAVLLGGDPGSLPEVQASDIVADLRGEQLELQRRLADASQLGQANSPRLAQINNQLDLVESQITDEIRRIAQMLNNEMAALSSRTVLLEEALQRAGGQSGTDSLTAVRLRELERQVEAYRLQYERYLNNAGMAADLSTFATSGALVVSAASFPLEPFYPPTKVFVILGFLLGVGLVLVYALLRDALKREFASIAGVEADLGLPVLSVLPRLPSGQEGYKIVRSDPFTAYSEAVSLLRQSLTGPGQGKTPIVLITSAEETVGKTTLAASLGESANASGKRVLMVDADLRFAGLSALYDMENAVGLCDILRGGDCLPEDEVGRDVLDVIPAGDLRGRSPSVYLDTPHFEQFLRVASRFYDLVIIDGPPVGNLADCRIMAEHCNEIVMVMRAERTPREALRSAIRHLPQRKLSGVVVTEADPASKTGQWTLSGTAVSSYMRQPAKRKSPPTVSPRAARTETTLLRPEDA